MKLYLLGLVLVSSFAMAQEPDLAKLGKTYAHQSLLSLAPAAPNDSKSATNQIKTEAEGRGCGGVWAHDPSAILPRGSKVPSRDAMDSEPTMNFFSDKCEILEADIYSTADCKSPSVGIKAKTNGYIFCVYKEISKTTHALKMNAPSNLPSNRPPIPAKTAAPVQSGSAL